MKTINLSRYEDGAIIDSIECSSVVYLDMNIIADMRQGRPDSIRGLCEKLYSDGYIFPYSPAHMEEIANVAREIDSESEADRLVNENVDFVARLSQYVEILRPIELSNPTRFVRECPSSCIQRVLDAYGLTYVSEAAANAVRSPWGDGTGTPPPKEVFELSEVQTLLQSRLASYNIKICDLPKGEELCMNHELLEKVISSMFYCLSEVGYSREPKKKTRSAIHDVTHAIYGVMSDVFVSNDKKFTEKLRVVYSFLEAETEILTSDELCLRFRK